MNQSFVPDFLKTLMFEFMTWFVNLVRAAHPFLPVIQEGLDRAPEKRVIPIPYRAGAGFETVEPLLDPSIPVEKGYPEIPAGKERGLYLMVNSFHQLDMGEARRLLETIASRGQAVAILEGNNDSLRQILGMTIIVPLTILLTAPFVRPFRPGRILFTYLIPILPFMTLIDGSLALMKLYNPQDLEELVSTIPVPDYRWEAGKKDNGRGGKIIYLLGYPVR